MHEPPARVGSTRQYIVGVGPTYLHPFSEVSSSSAWPMPETQLWPARRASVNQEPEGIADTATRHRHTSCPWLRHPGVAGSNFLIVHIMQSRLPGSEWNVGTKDGFCRRNERGVSPAYLHKLPARSAPRIRQAFWGSDPAFGTQLWPMAGGAERCSGRERTLGTPFPPDAGGGLW